ncbi:Glutathione S-transferase 1 [Toxocara canis]|uniref:glutathione transferase n=1 Tax=Toxocara canis TaxID=6265 RepID=A0A0B2UXV7_TOXCA|nr:Glutathione S-transferase 1 [Toxocara canis]
MPTNYNNGNTRKTPFDFVDEKNGHSTILCEVDFARDARIKALTAFSLSSAARLVAIVSRPVLSLGVRGMPPVETAEAKLEKEVVIPARDKHVPAIEKFLAKSGSGYLVGKSVTWADLVISDSLATWETFVPSFLDGHSEVKKFVERIRELPNIKKWISERPKTPF